VAYLDDVQVEQAEAYIHDTTSSITIEEPYSPEIFDLYHKGQEYLAVLVGVRQKLNLAEGGFKRKTD